MALRGAGWGHSVLVHVGTAGRRETGPLGRRSHRAAREVSAGSPAPVNRSPRGSPVILSPAVSPRYVPHGCNDISTYNYFISYNKKA